MIGEPLPPLTANHCDWETVRPPAKHTEPGSSVCLGISATLWSECLNVGRTHFCVPNSAITVSRFASIDRVVVTFNYSLATYIKQKAECNTFTVLSHIMNVWLASFWIQIACLGCQGDAQHLLTQMPWWSPKLFFWAKAIIWDFPPFFFFLEESFSGFSASASGTDILPMCSSGLLGICLHHGPFLCCF